MSDKAIVYIERGEDRLETARRCAAEPLAALIRPGSRVLLKVNQVGGFPWQRGSTVCPDLIGEVALMVKEAGAGEVGIAEDVGRDQDTMAMWVETGTVEVAERVGATLVDLRQHPHPEQPVPGGLVVDRLAFSAPLLEWDLLVGVTKLKTHHHAGVTGAMKNLFGGIPDEMKRRFHRSDMDKAIVDINTVRRADFTIVDAFPAMEGLGPHSGDAVPMNLTIAGTDPIAVDAVGAAVMGFSPNWARYIRIAGEKGLGIADLSRIEVRGAPIAAVRRKFKTSLAQIAEMLGENVEVVDHTDCNGCACAVGTAFMLLLRRHGTTPEDLKGLQVHIGGDASSLPRHGKVLLVGDCCTGCDPHDPRWLRGCPPTITEVMNRISAADVPLTFMGSDTLPARPSVD